MGQFGSNLAARPASGSSSRPRLERLSALRARSAGRRGFYRAKAASPAKRWQVCSGE